MSSKSVQHECLTRVSGKSVQQACPVRMSRKRFHSRVFERVLSKNVPKGCLTRVFLQGCPTQEFSNVGAFGFVGSIRFFKEVALLGIILASWGSMLVVFETLLLLFLGVEKKTAKAIQPP